MSHFEYENENIPFQEGDSLLEALLRQGKDVAFSCKKGTCLSCMRKGDGPVSAVGRANLTEADRADGLLLMCQTPAQEGIRIFADDGGQEVSARIDSVTQLSDCIYKVLVTPDETIPFEAGQFVNFHLDNNVIRSYSIASLPDEEQLEFHIRLRADGAMSTWLCKNAKPGDKLTLRGPHGQCIYNASSLDQPILMVGTASGLAPLYGVLKDAIKHGHRGDIHLYHGSRFSADLYYKDELNALVHEHSNVHYTPCVSREYAGDDVFLGRAGEVAKQRHPNLSGWKVHLCGSPAMVQDMQQSCFIAGASLDDIRTDPFELMDRRRKVRGEPG